MLTRPRPQAARTIGRPRTVTPFAIGAADTATVNELARILRVSSRTIRRMMLNRPEDLPTFIRVGDWRITFVGVNAWLRARAAREEK
jgi:hypothetical protein